MGKEIDKNGWVNVSGNIDDLPECDKQVWVYWEDGNIPVYDIAFIASIKIMKQGISIEWVGKEGRPIFPTKWKPITAPEYKSKKLKNTN